MRTLLALLLDGWSGGVGFLSQGCGLGVGERAASARPGNWWLKQVIDQE
jgi:hypothetical protein